MTVLAIDTYQSNADLILACRDLGYIEGHTLDPTYGKGTFWKAWRPTVFVGTDIDPAKSLGQPVDFTSLPWDDGYFDTVVFDPPYKLNGTPDEAIDQRYGVHQPTRWQDRMDLCKRGIDECARVSRKWLLIKCQDQVCSGKVRWQTIEFGSAAVDSGFELVDMLHYVAYRPQPEGRSQIHARRNYSTMLVLRRDGA